MSQHEIAYSERRRSSRSTRVLAGHRFPYQEDMSLVKDDLEAATPGDLNWLEDIELLVEDGVPAVFDRYNNSFLKIYFAIPKGARTRSPARFSSRTCSQRAAPTASAESAAHGSPARARALGLRLGDGRSDWAAPVLEGWERPGTEPGPQGAASWS